MNIERSFVVLQIGPAQTPLPLVEDVVLHVNKQKKPAPAADNDLRFQI